MVQLRKTFFLVALFRTVTALRWSEDYVGYNLNVNETASDPLDYYGKWENHTFHPSPENWRFPVYTIFLDTFVNGDPTNDNANGTQFEHDMLQTQLRHGGDIQGVIDSLDYIQGMGIKGLYIAGSPFINEPWGADSYSPLDLTLLDLHYGRIEKYRDMVTEIHNRGMYIIMDNTMATMGNLNMAVDYENVSTPFSLSEHKQAWRDPSRQYLDFKWSNDYNETCEYPRFYLETGYEVGSDVTDQLKGCYNSEFDQYGDVEAFGVFPDWERQLSKFASVQDRLREWHDPVRAKIKHFACMTIMSLDIDGFRIDKSTQVTVDALGDWSSYMRECANSVNKTNFFIPGEITGGNTFGSIYLGRGRTPDMITDLTITEAVTLTSGNDSSLFIRDEGQNAVDAAAFHYSVYRSLTRFLGMDGNLASGYDVPVNWVDAWNEILVTNDLINPNTGSIDIRHMYGVANQDVFRWPAIANGTQRQLLGEFITTLQMPGIPMMLWGEEQAFYVLDNTASNYVFGRQSMSSAVAWQTHGCYTLGAEQYYDWPVNASLYGCGDDWNSKDHRDPSAPVRNVLKSMYEMRQNYPVLNDGFFLQQLSNYTRDVYYPGSEGVATQTGVWSVIRGEYDGVQDLSTSGGQGNQSVWLVYTNENHTKTVTFDCSSNDTALISPFPANTTVKNLFYPYEEYTLSSSAEKLWLYGSQEYNGCIDEMKLPQYGFKAFVPVDSFVTPSPTITKFTPGHDYRLRSTVAANEQEVVPIELYFSQEMNCEALKGSIVLNSTTENGDIATLDNSTVVCDNITAIFANDYVGTIPSIWRFSANLTNVSNGVHSLTIKNASNEDQTAYTGSVDKFLFRVGQDDNPIVFPMSANYTEKLLHQYDNGTLYVSHKAAGADYWRYTLDWTTYSDWMTYTGGNDTLEAKNWTGTKKQAWEGEHLIVQYYNQMSGSSDYQQHGDLSATQIKRRFPHLFAHGKYNEYGYDAGLKDEMEQDDGGTWRFNFMTEWTDETLLQINVWGMNPDGEPDQTSVYGDVDDDGVLDRMAPSSLATKAINITSAPAWPHLGYLVSITDSDLRYTLTPMGNQWMQLAMYIIMWVVPIVTAVLSVWLYMKSFYSVKFNTDGVTEKAQYIPLAIRRRLGRAGSGAGISTLSLFRPRSSQGDAARQAAAVEAEAGSGERRTVLIATMEYDIEDWAIKIKIGGLGVMAQLMGKSLGTQDLIWVVPCVGGIDYPEDTPAESMYVTILGETYEVQVQYHILRNITYVLLDAPVFRAQSKSVPYPARMDDLESAIYYSTWNQCIAETVKRFPIDLYHINDYHGACAPLYLLPHRTIPCALSLHNAEFQGLWPLRSAKEQKEVCEVFNLPPEIVKKYVQFGDVFNLLHAAASYLRVHQKGFGAVGVSKKYGARSHARYPIFWGLDKIGQLPNPDPSDTEEWTGEESKVEVKVDEEFEAARPELKRQAQEWASLDQNPNAELLVFVGRWSMQKGVDLIADVMPHVLETNPNVQLICVGPQIDLYGKFAALKLDVMMKKYPGRVYSKPEFTALPPFIFSGAEFALIPSRDEPFGLVAVEFGRKGALGIGARVGGLGQMPGWWFTVESTTTSHMLHQFKIAIRDALASDTQTRRVMRAKSAKQRFPVAQWIAQLEKLQSKAIKKHEKEALKRPATARTLGSGLSHLNLSRPHSANNETSSDEDQYSSPNTPGTPEQSRPVSRNLPVFAPRLGGNPSGDYALPGDVSHLESPGGSPRTSMALGDNSQADYMPRTPGALGMSLRSGTASVVSLSTIVGEKTDFQLQKIDPDFTDSRGEYYKSFEQSLDRLNGSNSEDQLCIEEYLVKSERKWFGQFRDAKLGRSSLAPSRRNSLFGSRSIAASEVTSIGQGLGSTMGLAGIMVAQNHDNEKDEWLLGADYAPPTGVQWLMSYRIGDWPVYSLFLAFGQIIAANSYQISLLTGSTGQTANQLYEIAGVYLATSMIWWAMFMRFKSLYTLSLPFFFYGLAFLLLGTAPFASTGGRSAMKTIATLMYATASSSGSIFFALNFGDEGGSPVKTWVFRSCVIQGTQTIYITALWAWGSYLTKETNLGFKGATISTSNKTMAYIAIPIAVLLWVIGVLIYIGLPKYYRQQPGKVPSFYRSLFRRKVVLWFFCYVLIQNFFLSSLTGRNWSYLWSSNHAKIWQIVLLVLLFFIGVWAAFLWGFSILSRDHSWILPIFAIGLIAPRWAQILWSCSNIGMWVPWAGSPLASALVGRSLWLWLGTLDAIQGVGFGMILLQTLTRVHIASTLTAAQILGSLATIVARAAGPSQLGPGDVFPDFTPGVYPGARKAWFWIGLIFQFIICAGFFRFFRKEQLSKP